MLFRYSVTAHNGGWKGGGPRRFGWSASNPLMPVVVHGKRSGTLGRKESFCRVDKPNVLLLTLKRAEDGDGMIIRLIETEGKETEVEVSLPGVRVSRACRTDLVEGDKGAIAFTEHSVTAPIEGFGIATIRIQTN